LSELSERGRLVPEIGRSDVRELIDGNYRLIYELTADAVTVVGVIHGALDLAKLWRRDPR